MLGSPTSKQTHFAITRFLPYEQSCPPARYTTNANESSNFVIKKWVGFTKSTWPAFVDKLQNLIEAKA